MFFSIFSIKSCFQVQSFRCVFVAFGLMKSIPHLKANDINATSSIESFKSHSVFWHLNFPMKQSLSNVCTFVSPSSCGVVCSRPGDQGVEGGESSSS